jgi:hypothetical protein
MTTRVKLVKTGGHMGCYEEFGWKDPENGKNDFAPVLFKEFHYRGWDLNKSHLIKEEDIRCASRVKKSNSISMLEALKLRWEICIPRTEDNGFKGVIDLKRGRTPLHQFVREYGLELWLDMNEVIDVRIQL